MATDATIAGKPASALPGEVTQATKVSEFFGTTWSSEMAAPADIEAVMSGAPDGARGIVLGVPPNSNVGHFFNVAKRNGSVVFLDGQAGGAATLTPYANFYLLRTN